MSARIDPLVAEVARILSPLPAPEREKAAMLMARLAASSAISRGSKPRGVGDAVRRLRAELPDEDILAGAHSLLLEAGGLLPPRNGLPGT